MGTIPPIGGAADKEGGYREPIVRDRTPEQDEIQRTITPVGRGRLASNRLGAGAAVAAVVVALVFINTGHHRGVEGATNMMAMSPDAVQHPDDRARQTVAMANPSLAAPLPGAPSLTADSGQQLAVVPRPDGTVVPAIDPGSMPPPPGAVQQPGRAETLASQARRAPLLITSGSPSGAEDANRGEGGQGSAAAPEGKPNASQAAPAGELDTLRQVSAIGQSRAAVLPNRNYLITAGTLLPCILQTAMNSTQPGYTSCIIPRDIYSDDGHVVLMEKGTKVLGQYQGGIGQGQNRIFVVWTRAITPRGIAVELASPASDALGRAGIAGAVDTFFWARFGAALMLSLVDDASSIAAAHLAGQGSYTTQVPSSAAGTALQSTINIKPVLKKNQGEEVGIFVAKDFNFADVYGLKLVR